MNDQQSQFWSKAARNYDRVVDLQIGPATRLMVRERIGKEAALGKVAEFGCGTGFYTRLWHLRRTVSWPRIYLRVCLR